MSNAINKQKNSLNITFILQLIALAVIFVILLVAVKTLLKDDAGQFYKWYIAITALGLTFYPFSNVLFESFNDKGWLFSKTLGLAFTGWLVWVFASIKVMKFSFASCIVALLLSLVLNVFIAYKGLYNASKGLDRKDCILHINLKTFNINSVILSEIIFLGFFLAWTYVKCFRPEAHGTEKFMDYGFMQAIFKSDYMPPEDIWMSGVPINYYYIGQYLSTYLCKFANVEVKYGYNLMLTMIASLGFALPYSIISNVMNNHLKTKKFSAFRKDVLRYLSGILAGTAVAFCGNCHYILYSKIIPVAREMLGINQLATEANVKLSSYWFPSSTRYIGYFPETSDKTIHEFPSYSFVLGDLHAHVINIIFVLTIVAVLYSYTKNTKNKLLHEMLHPAVITAGFLIGIFKTSNFWDFPIYFVVSGAVILFTNCRKHNFSIKTIKLTGIHAVIVIAVSFLTSIMFILSFNQISTEIRKTVNTTPLYQLFILWGLPVLVLIVFLVTTIRDNKTNGIFDMTNKEFPGKDKYLFRFLANTDNEDLFILTLGLCAAGLVLIPEIIYVKDIYTGDYKRANTMFKLTYQAFIMFGMMMGYTIPKLILAGKTVARRTGGIIFAIILISTAGYTYTAVNSWFGDISDSERYKGLDATTYLSSISAADDSAVKWINENIEGRPVMLEANGDSYTDYCRISVNTGLPTVMGWSTHEWLWQSDGSEGVPQSVTERKNDVNTIYTSDSSYEVKTLADKYNIDYIYVGNLEKSKFSDINYDVLLSLGEVVYPLSFDSTYASRTTFIIKVNRD